MIPRSALLRQTATIIRNFGQRNAFGEWEPGTPVEVEVGCVSQPDTGQQRVLDDSGSRTEGRRFWWFPESVDMRLAGDGHTTDTIRHGDGEVYRVVEIQRWQGSHVRVVGSRVDNQGGN